MEIDLALQRFQLRNSKALTFAYFDDEFPKKKKIILLFFSLRFHCIV